MLINFVSHTENPTIISRVSGTVCDQLLSPDARSPHQPDHKREQHETGIGAGHLFEHAHGKRVLVVVRKVVQVAVLKIQETERGEADKDKKTGPCPAHHRIAIGGGLAF